MVRIDYEKDISAETILGSIFLAGAILVAATSPYFLFGVAKILFKNNNFENAEKKKFGNSYYYLLKSGLIETGREGNDIKISLTEKGKKRLKKYKIDKMEIKKPKTWDKRWRVVIFDIPNAQRTARNIFRRKLKGLGFYSLQKSVWLHAFECKKEIEALRNFLGINDKQIQVLIVDEVESEVLNKRLKNIYGI